MVGHGQTLDKPWFALVLVTGSPATSNPHGKQKIVRNRGEYLTIGQFQGNNRKFQNTVFELAGTVLQHNFFFVNYVNRFRTLFIHSDVMLLMCIFKHILAWLSNAQQCLITFEYFKVYSGM